MKGSRPVNLKPGERVSWCLSLLRLCLSQKVKRFLAFLQKLKALAEKIKGPSVRIFEPVPLTVQKVMDIERGQLLIEADNKVEMQKFLNRFQPEALSLKAKGSWYIDVDPLNY